VQRSLCGTPTKLCRAHGGKIRVTNGANVLRCELYDRLRVAGEPNELDFDGVSAVDMNDRAEISTAKPMLREIPLEDDCVELLNAHESRSLKTLALKRPMG
jgi:hypothetical protein